MDREFLSFCYLIVNFFSEKKIEESAQELIDCINCTRLLRDKNEIIYRILLRESDIRQLDLREYLVFIAEFNLINPIVTQIEIDSKII